MSPLDKPRKFVWLITTAADERCHAATGMRLKNYIRLTARKTSSLINHAAQSTAIRHKNYGGDTGITYAAWVDAWRRYESIRSTARVTTYNLYQTREDA